MTDTNRTSDSVSKHSLNRRRLLQVAGASSAMLFTGRKASARILGANDRLRIAVAGLNGRGQSHIDGWLKQENVEIAWVIDPDQNALARGIKIVQEKSGGKSNPQGTADVRHALEDKTLDALSIATPNHWHSLMTIWGAQAGKHVYVEKPMSHDVAEGRIAMEAQKKYGVVVQHGTQAAAAPRLLVCTKPSTRASLAN